MNPEIHISIDPEWLKNHWYYIAVVVNTLWFIPFYYRFVLPSIHDWNMAVNRWIEKKSCRSASDNEMKVGPLLTAWACFTCFLLSFAGLCLAGALTIILSVLVVVFCLLGSIFTTLAGRPTFYPFMTYVVEVIKEIVPGYLYIFWTGCGIRYLYKDMRSTDNLAEIEQLWELSRKKEATS